MTRLVFIPLALALAACGDAASQATAPVTKSTLAPGRAEVEELRATQITIHRVDPRSERPQARGLAAWKILESKEVESPEIREKIIAVLLKNQTYGDMGAKCFDPRDAITLKNAAGKTIDVVICFECGWIYFYDGPKFLAGPGMGSGVSELSALLRQVLPVSVTASQ